MGKVRKIYAENNLSFSIQFKKMVDDFFKTLAGFEDLSTGGI
jgi:hypothetical protein